MIRNDWYCTYKGKEHRFGKSKNTLYYLLGDKSDVQNGFKETDGRYIAHVGREEIENPVDISTYATYRGNDFLIFAEENGQYLLIGNTQAARDCEFEQVRPGEWEKLVDKNDPDLEKIFEKITPITL